MRLFLVQHLLVFISVLSLIRAQTASISSGATSETTATTVHLFDPCNNYTVLDDSWRATNNYYSNQAYSKLLCDLTVDWVGWYRFFIFGQSVKMADTCVNVLNCGAVYSLALNGGHPTVQDGVVTRNVCGASNGVCCFFQSTPIKVKACPGGFYVYELVKPSIGCPAAYCADVQNIISTPVSTTAAPQIFYSFGSAAGDTIIPAGDDGSSSVIQLMSPFVFFSRTYQQIYVNNNGFLTFSQASQMFTPYSFPSFGTQDFIAGLWTDIDNRVRGVISYHLYNSGNVLTQATQDINNYFPNLNFSASWVFVATWKKVAYFAFSNTETSFQVVLIAGSNFSFILMNYGDIAVTGQKVEAGYDTVYSTNFFVIPGSINGSSISNLKNSSNVNVPGRWAFRVDGGPKSNTVFLFDPCYNYTVLDDPWRATSSQITSQPYYKVCDYNVDWVGWYRLFNQGKSIHMPDTCIQYYSCTVLYSMWLSGGHPAVEDGVVTRGLCMYANNNCCGLQSTPIRVKACPGGYYVYELVKPSYACYYGYCAEVRAINPTTVRGSAGPVIFYPFGSVAGDTNNPAADDGGSSVQLMSPFVFFGVKYQQISVNNNGFLTFSQPSSAYVPYTFPANGGQDIIAGLWTDLDNRVTGIVSYHQYTSGNVLTRATQDINNYFPNQTFNASWVFAATWNKVAYYPLSNTETSFQVVLISGSHYSFILMNYGDIAATGLRVEAGYDTVSSTNYSVIPGSINGSSISNLKNSSNVNVPGRWAFRVDGDYTETIIGLQMKLSSYLVLTPDNGDIQTVLQQIKQELVKYGLSKRAELKLRKVRKTMP